MSGLLTTSEHQRLAIGDGPDELSPDEAERLAILGRERPGFYTPGHRSIRLAQYAGLVNLGGRVLEILPKVDEGNTASADRGTFLRLLHAARDVPIHARGSVAHATEQRPLLAVFIAAFLDEVSVLVRGGLLRRYRARTEDLRVVRGRLQVARQAGAHGMRPDLLACRFDELSIDNPSNQVLRAALAAARPWIESVDDARRWLEIVAAFEGVALRRDAVDLLDALRVDRQTRRYEAATRWAALILRLLSPNVRSGAQAAPEMLFDMNRLFESAIAGSLRQRLRLRGLEVATQDRSHSLEARERNPAFLLRPDIVIRQGARTVAVADTKWAAVEIGKSGRLEPSEAHVYQMAAYASAHECEDFHLVYPWRSEFADASPSSFRLKQRHGSGVNLHVVCVDVGADGFPLRHGAFQFSDQ